MDVGEEERHGAALGDLPCLVEVRAVALSEPVRAPVRERSQARVKEAGGKAVS